MSRFLLYSLTAVYATDQKKKKKNLSFLVTFSALSSVELVSYSSNFTLFTFLLLYFIYFFFIVMSLL